MSSSARIGVSFLLLMSAACERKESTQTPKPKQPAQPTRPLTPQQGASLLQPRQTITTEFDGKLRRTVVEYPHPHYPDSTAFEIGGRSYGNVLGLGTKYLLVPPGNRILFATEASHDRTIWFLDLDTGRTVEIPCKVNFGGSIGSQPPRRYDGLVEVDGELLTVERGDLEKSRYVIDLQKRTIVEKEQ